MQKNWLFPVFVGTSVFLFSCLFENAWAAGQPLVGRKAASRYFQKDSDQVRKPAQLDESGGGGAGGGEQLLMLSLGTYIGSKSYQWKGSDSRDNVGRTSYGVTYLFDHWGSMDVNLRVDFNEYRMDDDRLTKMSILPLITFPPASARFPLYFGIGAGLGVFFKQIPEESNLSFDYQLVAGARFMDLFENFGFFFELGMKNHLHLLSDGQLNGSTLTAGAVFSF